MSSPAYLPLFGNDYLADTRHLTTEEHGAYLLLMMAAWRQEDCGLPLDDKKLSRIAGLSTRKWGQIRSTILEFWQVENGRIYQRRLLKERGYALQKSESNRQNARKRWSAQTTENIESGESERICERNAPQPQPKEDKEPNGSSSSLPCASEAGSDDLFPDDLGGGDHQDHAPKPKRKSTIRTTGVDQPFPEDWEPTLGPTARRIVERWPPGMLDREAFAFRSHAEANGRLAKNWDAAFGTWIAKAEDRRTQNANRNANFGGAPSGHRPIGARVDGFTAAINDEVGRTRSRRPA